MSEKRIKEDHVVHTRLRRCWLDVWLCMAWDPYPISTLPLGCRQLSKARPTIVGTKSCRFFSFHSGNKKDFLGLGCFVFPNVRVRSQCLSKTQFWRIFPSQIIPRTQGLILKGQQFCFPRLIGIPIDQFFVVSVGDRCWRVTFKAKLGGGFKYFLFSSLFGDMIQFD